jgi:hypothetical protein
MSCKAIMTVVTITMVGVSPRAGWGTDQPVPGSKLSLKQTTTASASFTGKTPALIAPTPGGSDDPRMTGATVRIYNPQSGESATFQLPAPNWTANASGTTFKFVNPVAPAPPSEVRVASIRTGRAIKVRAKASGITLDETSQGSIGIVLTSGTTRYCALFGGIIRRDEPGRFQARNAPAPLACPSEATTTTTTATSTTETTESSTTVSTSTSTTVPSCPPPAVPLGSIAFTIDPGSSDCGGRRITPGPTAPFSGEIDDGMGVKLRDLGVGCLYIGGGTNGALPPAAIPPGGTAVLNISGASGLSLTLASSDGTGPDPAANCTRGAGPGKHCVNAAVPLPACTSDADCGGGQAGSCLLDANCFFGPPLAVPVPTTPAVSTCVVNVIQTDACGSADLLTMGSSLSVALSTRLYLTGDPDSPCPECVTPSPPDTCLPGEGPTCCSAGARAGESCTDSGPSNQCPPLGAQYVGNLPVTLSPLTTGTTTVTEPSGFFCPGQIGEGAFGRSQTRTIRETGTPLSGVPPLIPFTATLAGVFCTPSSGSGLVDGILDLPGPAAVSVTGTADICFPPLLPCP